MSTEVERIRIITPVGGHERGALVTLSAAQAAHLVNAGYATYAK